MIEELVGRVFATRNAVHLEHWKTKSYAQHVALGELYDNLIDKIDTVVETYQGAFDLIDAVKIPNISSKNMLDHLNDEAEWLESNIDELSGGIKALENVLQDLSGVYYHAIYKLTNLS